MGEIVIYNAGDWRITRQLHWCTDPMVVNFRRRTWSRTLLNQTARWTPLGWDQGRWVPKSPKVPQDVLDLVVQHMLQVEA